MKSRPSYLLVPFLLAALSTGLVPHAYASGGGGHGGAKSEGGHGGGEKKEKGDSDVSGGRFEGDPIYVRLQPLVMPVINSRGAEQIVTLLLTVEVKNFDAVDQMHSHMPKVMDSLMRNLYGGMGNGNLRNGKLVDVDKVKNKAIKAVSEAIGEENVKDVLIQGVSQRML